MMARHPTDEAAIAAQYAILDRVAEAEPMVPSEIPARSAMAMAAMGDAYFNADLSSSETVVAAFLHWFTARYRGCDLSVSAIARCVKLTEKTVRAAIRRLADMCEIRIVFGSGRRPHQYLPKFTAETYAERLKIIHSEGYSDRTERLLNLTKRGSITAEATEITPEEVNEINRRPVNETAQAGANAVNETVQTAGDAPANAVNETGQADPEVRSAVNQQDDKKESLTSTLTLKPTLTLPARARAQKGGGGDSEIGRLPLIPDVTIPDNLAYLDPADVKRYCGLLARWTDVDTLAGSDVERAEKRQSIIDKLSSNVRVYGSMNVAAAFTCAEMAKTDTPGTLYAWKLRSMLQSDGRQNIPTGQVKKRTWLLACDGTRIYDDA